MNSALGDGTGERITIRASRPADLPRIERLYPDAFPGEDLLPLVGELLRLERGVLSLVAIGDGSLAGHAAFTMGSIAGRDERVALLGPLAVAPRLQRRGVGSALVREGIQRLKSVGTAQVYVLGDPDYYGRFGFRPDDGVVPPSPLPPEWLTAWQSLALRQRGPALAGALRLPAPWLRPELWAP